MKAAESSKELKMIATLIRQLQLFLDFLDDSMCPLLCSDRQSNTQLKDLSSSSSVGN